MTDLDLFPPTLLNPQERDPYIALLHRLSLTPTARIKHFTAWSKAVGYTPTAADYIQLGADIG